MSIKRLMDKQNVIYTYNKILFSHKKGIKFLVHVTGWMNLENIMPSEINQTQKDEYCMIPFM